MDGEIGMAIFDFTHLNALTQMKELFPELTDKQFRLAFYWAWGSDIQAIASMNDSSSEAVKKILHRSKERLGLDSIDILRNVIILRVLASMWGNAIRHKTSK